MPSILPGTVCLSRIWLSSRGVLSSGIERHVVRSKPADVSEEYFVRIFRIDNWSKPWTLDMGKKCSSDSSVCVSASIHLFSVDLGGGEDSSYFLTSRCLLPYCEARTCTQCLRKSACVLAWSRRVKEVEHLRSRWHNLYRSENIVTLVSSRRF
jgi:hypothetical protein